MIFQSMRERPMTASLKPQAGPSRKRKTPLEVADAVSGQIRISEHENGEAPSAAYQTTDVVVSSSEDKDIREEGQGRLLDQLIDEKSGGHELVKDDSDEAHSNASEPCLAVLDRLLADHSMASDTLRDISSIAGEIDTEYNDDLLFFDTRGYKDKAQTVLSNITGIRKIVWPTIIPEDDSEDGQVEKPMNRIGEVPAHFYDDLPHIGYNIDGKRVMRPARGDELDKFLSTMTGDAWTSVNQKSMQTDMQLTNEELDLIKRLAASENPDVTFDPYAQAFEIYTGQDKVLQMPLSDKPEPKRRFIPSKWEHMKVMKIVRAIREGRIIPRKPSARARPNFYALWTDADGARTDPPVQMPAPKIAFPGHAESYNPPSEYLFSPSEREEWDQAEPDDRKLDYVPKKFRNLRTVPGYSDFVQQRFDRLLDLYMAPRALRTRNARLDELKDPELLTPELPNPDELRPFPSACGAVYQHPSGVRIRCVSIDPEGLWIATGAEDGQIRLWELQSGRCQAHWQIGVSPVTGLDWSPELGTLLLAAAVEGKVYLVAALELLDPNGATLISTLVNAGFPASASNDLDTTWSEPSNLMREQGVLVQITLTGAPSTVTWHHRGDYFATVTSDGGSDSVLVHQLSKHRSQAPFRRLKSPVQCVAFHPIRPHLFVATQRHVRIYDLPAQKWIKTLEPGFRWISSISIHPLGNHVVVGSYDKHLAWHDLDLSDRPYKIIRNHSRAVRAVAFHSRHPLLASASDDGSVQILHATVYSDLSSGPLLVPLRALRGHDIKASLGVLDVKWHPCEAFCVSVGVDGIGRLWS